jgi:hypothetical protein
MRIVWIVLAILFAIVAGSCVDWEVQGIRVHRTFARLATEFPRGISESSAQKIVYASYPEHTRYSVTECERWSHLTTPSYSSRGGPCIFGIVTLGATWWGFESAVTSG